MDIMEIMTLEKDPFIMTEEPDSIQLFTLDGVLDQDD